VWSLYRPPYPPHPATPVNFSVWLTRLLLMILLLLLFYYFCLSFCNLANKRVHYSLVTTDCRDGCWPGLECVVWVTCTGRTYGVIFWLKNAAIQFCTFSKMTPVRTGRKSGPYVRPRRTGRLHRAFSPLLAVPNVTTHPSTASVPTSYYLMWHYNCLWTLKVKAGCWREGMKCNLPHRRVFCCSLSFISRQWADSCC